MKYRSLVYNRFSRRTAETSAPAIQSIVNTIRSGLFPGSQLYLYYKMNHNDAAIDSSEFITDTAFIYKYRMQKEDNTIGLLSKHFPENKHIDNIYSIIQKSWEILKDSETSLHPYV